MADLVSSPMDGFGIISDGWFWDHLRWPMADFGIISDGRWPTLGSSPMDILKKV